MLLVEQCDTGDTTAALASGTAIYTVRKNGA